MTKDKGWLLQINGSEKWNILRTTKAIKVGIVGVYNRGKTTVANLLSGRETAAGNLAHTQGLSAIVDKQKFIYLDTAGQNQPIEMYASVNQPLEGEPTNQKIDEIHEITNTRLISDLFASDMVVAMSDVLVVLVNQLTLEDQRYVKVLENKVKESRTQIIVVHNLKDTETVEELHKLIQNDIVSSFGCEEELWGEKKYWTRSGQISHLVLGREGTAAGKAFNQQTCEIIKHIMDFKKMSGGNGAEQKLSLLAEFDRYVGQNLHKYFKNMPEENCKLYCEHKPEEGLNLYVKPKMDGKQSELRGNAIVSEWQIIWGAKYELDYELIKRPKKCVTVNVDVPGVFSHGPDQAIRKDTAHGPFKHEYTWTEKLGGKDVKVLEVIVRTARSDEQGPSVEVTANRREVFEAVAGKTPEKVRDSGKHGKVYRTINLQTIFDAFEQHSVIMAANGTLTVKLETHDALSQPQHCGCVMQ